MTYRFYLNQHRMPQTRRWHALVTTAAVAYAVYAVAWGVWWTAGLALPAALALNAPQHWVWEKNRPASWGGPFDLLWAIVWDLRMTVNWWCGRDRGFVTRPMPGEHQ